MVQYFDFNNAISAYTSGQKQKKTVDDRRSFREFAQGLRDGNYNAAAASIAQTGDVNGSLNVRNIPYSDRANELGNEFTRVRIDDVGIDNQRADRAFAATQAQRQFANARAEAEFRMQQAKASSTLGKLKMDLDRGFLTPEQYQAAVTKATAPSKGVTVNNMTTALQNDLSKSEAAIKTLENGITDYKKMLETYEGRAYMPGQARDALINARRNIQMQAKELYNLGVLNGPDLELMDSMLFDATPSGLDAAGAMIQDAFSDPVKRGQANADQLMKQYRDILDNKRSAYTGGQQEQPAGRGVPQPGMIEDGYQFKGGDPADPNNWQQVQ